MKEEMLRVLTVPPKELNVFAPLPSGPVLDTLYLSLGEAMSLTRQSAESSLASAKTKPYRHLASCSQS